MLEEPEIRALFHGIPSAYGTHRPALCEAIVRTTGPILELGMGDSSTPALHSLAEASGRAVSSYDHDASWVKRYLEMQSESHRVEHVASWDACPIEAARWGVAFVDHAPGDRRIVDIARLVEHADVVVVHDTDDTTYGYDRVFGSFAYRLDYRDEKPWTTVLSNRIDVSRWSFLEDGLVATRPRTLRTSVLVPCAGEHVEHLPTLLAALRSQTRQPDEIIVAVSGCARADLPAIDAVVVHSDEKLSAGANRNRASAVATGDIFIYQDADDLPHGQRVDIIAALFERYAIDHLMHFFYYLQNEASQFSHEEAANRSAYYSKLMREVARYEPGLVEYVTNGNVAVTREIAQSVRWPEQLEPGEDQSFNRAVYARTKRTVVTPLPLITYRHNLSTFRTK